MINFLNLEYFLVLSQELSFSQAAKRLFISQQSLSAHISRMEKELGVSLYNRTKPLSLTAAGRHLQLRAQEIVALRDQTMQELSSSTVHNTDKISIGASYAYGRAVLPKILPAFIQECPNVHLSLYECNAQQLDESLSNGDIDLILGRMPFMAPNVQSIPLFEDQMVLMIPDAILEKNFGQDTEAFRRSLTKTTNLQMLKDCPFLLTAQGRVRSLSDDIFLKSSFTPRVIMETETIETAVVLCRSGLGALITPTMFIRDSIPTSSDISIPGISIIPLSNQTFGTIAFGYLKDHFITNAMESLINIAFRRLGTTAEASTSS